MDRNTYIRDVYSKYYVTARGNKYGFQEYDRNICSFISNCVVKGAGPGKFRLLEVAVGTGYPIADTFEKAGFEVHGVDLSPRLVEKCRELNPKIHAVVGDASSLSYSSDDFDAVYCIHASWFLSDLRKAISEMLRVVKKGGVVIFDIQNRDNPDIAKIFRKHQWELRGVGCIWRQAKNIIKVITRRGYPNWRLVVHQVPSYPADIDMYLNENGREYDVKVYVRLPDASIREIESGKSLSGFDRLIYVVKKIN